MKKEYRKGEKVFDMVYPMMMMLYFPLKIMPKFISRLFWTLFRDAPGYIGIGIRYVLLKRLCPKCGKNIAILPSVFLNIGKNLQMGSHISIREQTFIDGDELTIGDNVMISHSASILSGSHYYDENIPMRDLLKDTPVKIGSNVWIGAGAKIIGEVNIGDNVIIGANAVVTKDIPSNSVAVGVPARVIKKLGKQRED